MYTQSSIVATQFLNSLNALHLKHSSSNTAYAAHCASFKNNVVVQLAAAAKQYNCVQFKLMLAISASVCASLQCKSIARMLVHMRNNVNIYYYVLRTM